MTTKYSSIEQNRLEKVERLRSQGIEPYPTRAERTHTSQEAIAASKKPKRSYSRGGGTRARNAGRPAALDPRDGQDHLCAHRGWLRADPGLPASERHRAGTARPVQPGVRPGRFHPGFGRDVPHQDRRDHPAGGVVPLTGQVDHTAAGCQGPGGGGRAGAARHPVGARAALPPALRRPGGQPGRAADFPHPHNHYARSA